MRWFLLALLVVPLGAAQLPAESLQVTEAPLLNLGVETPVDWEVAWEWRCTTAILYGPEASFTVPSPALPVGMAIDLEEAYVVDTTPCLQIGATHLRGTWVFPVRADQRTLAGPHSFGMQAELASDALPSRTSTWNADADVDFYARGQCTPHTDRLDGGRRQPFICDLDVEVNAPVTARFVSEAELDQSPLRLDPGRTERQMRLVIVHDAKETIILNLTLRLTTDAGETYEAPPVALTFQPDFLARATPFPTWPAVALGAIAWARRQAR